MLRLKAWYHGQDEMEILAPSQICSFRLQGEGPTSSVLAFQEILGVLAVGDLLANAEVT